MAEVVERLSCSNCGAPLEYEPGEIIVTCKYCGFTNVIETGRAFTLEHSMIVNRFDAQGVEGLVREWMRSGFLKPKDLEKASKVSEISLTYLPFWIVPVEAKSHYKGLFERIGPRIVKEGDISKRYDWLVLGREASEFPTSEYKVPLEDKIPFNITKIQQGAKVLNSEVDGSEAVDMAKQQIELQHEFLVKQDVDRIVEIKTDMSVGSTVYLHAPIWFIAYTYKDNNYRVILDGATGDVVKADIPPVEEFKLF